MFNQALLLKNSEPSPFSPLSISGCVLWLDANDPAGNGIQPADGSLISTWVDKSGVAGNATQSNPDYKPTYTYNLQNGKPGINYDVFEVHESILEIPQTTALNLTSGFTIFIVANNKYGENSPWVTKKNALDGISFQVGWVSVNQAQYCNNTACVYSSGTNIPLGVGSLSCWRAGTNTTDIYLNTSSIYHDSGQAPPIAINATTWIGTDNGLTQYFYGYWFEIVIYNRELDSGEIDQLNTYFNDKWDLY